MLHWFSAREIAEVLGESVANGSECLLIHRLLKEIHYIVTVLGAAIQCPRTRNRSPPATSGDFPHFWAF